MTTLADDRVVQVRVMGNVRSIDVQHTEILQGRHRSIEQASGTGNPHAEHADNHAGSPLTPIAR
jgi:hypothetical protein